MARVDALRAAYPDIASLREQYRREMSCQIVHDSLHTRAGWTVSYLLRAGGEPVGYGSVAIGGPWAGAPTVFELYVDEPRRPLLFDLFRALQDASGAVAVVTQTNDPILPLAAQTFGRTVVAEKILFHDQVTTTLPAGELVFRATTPEDRATMFPHGFEPVGDWVVREGGRVVATGGVLYHYNRPYGDVYIEVDAPSRRRGVGSFLVQELKRVCREGGSVPAARCSVDNIGSRRTLLKAGFAPCGHILTAELPPP